NSATLTAKPGQVVTLWGTGLGPISAPDNVPPPAGDLAVPVEILVGGKPAAKQYSGRTPCCSGVDQIVFRVPADAPPGCFVPVLVRAGGTYSNTVTMSIDPQGRPCSDPFNVLSPARLGGEKQGMILLLRLSAKAQLEAGQPPADIVVDLGLGSFAESAAGAASYNPILSLPPIGSCSVTTQSGVDLGSLLGGQLPGTFSGGRSLDAGPALTVTGPAGSKSMPRSDSAYVGFLGGAALLGSSASPLFLAPGSYQVTGTGGADVGPFSANVTIPPPVVWTNRDQLTSVNRAQGLNVAWTGGDLTGQLALIVGFNVDQQAQAGGLFLCLAPLEAGGFTVPASALANIPPSNVGQPDQSFGFLMLGALPHRNISSFTAAGLDSGFALYLSLDGTTISFQ
ncbi:MAG: hypothetical protein HY236_11685, partial [Acidobacteria bacterium]|nr:hypothetical protein [Acidobacteriota bacterium]